MLSGNLNYCYNVNRVEIGSNFVMRSLLPISYLMYRVGQINLSHLLNKLRIFEKRYLVER